MELVQERLASLCEADLTRQRWFIRASFASLPRSTDAAHAVRSLHSEAAPTLDAGRLLAAAEAIGDRLEALAIRDGEHVSWLGLAAQAEERQWAVVPMTPDLYTGMPGVALFLGYLSDVTGEARHARLAREVLVSLRRQLADYGADITTVGGYYGWGGVIYALTHLGVLWNDPSLLDEAEGMVERLPALIEADTSLDILTGSAGCIGGLLALYRVRPSPATLAAAVLCGERLLATAQPTEHGIGWLSPAAGERPLAGFSHGAAGCAWALLELAAVTGDERFRMAALAAIADERTLFSATAGNWLDLRPGGALPEAEGGEGAGVTAWCHGAPGIGLGRVMSLPHLDDPNVRAEIEIAVKTTLEHGFGANHSLCHGDLGNLDLVLEAGRVLQEPRWQQATEQMAARILDSIERNGCLCGVPFSLEVPGLMTGIAGIGYELLRVAEPERVPSVLGLAPPPARPASTIGEK